MFRLRSLRLILLLTLACCVNRCSTRAAEDASPLDLFEQRIMPIFRSPDPSSCVQCHLSSVDLKDYIRPSHKQTFVSLRDQGLIDVDSPEQSKILTLISMGEKDRDEGARLIHQNVRTAEFEAFAAWIKACCVDPELRNLPPALGTEPVGPAQAEPVIRHARKSRVLDSFVRNVWSQRMRCFPCHTPYEVNGDNAQHQVPIERRTKLEETFGDAINIFQESPEATLAYLIARSRETPDDELPLINLEQPQHSLLVLKPTSKLPPRDENKEFDPPSNAVPVSHMGGLKMHVNDQSYKSFIAWIEDYARVVEGDYKSVDDLPADNWYPTQYVLRIKDTPASWPKLSSVQLFVHAWNDQSATWSTEPIAFTQGAVTPRGMVNGALTLLAPKDPSARKLWSDARATMMNGRFLVKAYTDSAGRLEDDPTILLGADDFAGQAEFEAAWQEGFKNAEVISGGSLAKVH